MGIITINCQKSESEEEMISRILNSMLLSEIETKSVYNEFLKCYNKDDKILNYFQFKTLLDNITGESGNKKCQLAYFENLRKLGENNENMKKIGITIIYLSKSSLYQKTEILALHFITFYEEVTESSIKEFIEDIIELNTSNCLSAFIDKIGQENLKLMCEIWSNTRKQKLVLNIFQNFETVKHKNCFNLTTEDNSNSESSLSNSPEIKRAKKVQSDQILRFPISRHNSQDLHEFYEQHNKSMSELLFKNKIVPIDEEIEEKECDKLIKEFFDLSYYQLTGEYIRSWLYEDYLTDKSEENSRNN